jgi:hypothetical protein
MCLKERVVTTFLALVFLFTSGCSTIILGERYAPLIPGETSVVLSGKGIIVGSVQEVSKGRLSRNTYFYYTNKNTGDGGTLATTGQPSNVFPIQDNDFEGQENTRGRVFAFALPPGSYEFDGWLVDNGTGASYMSRFPRKAPFVVEEDRVVYLGNFNMQLVTGKNAFEIEIVAGGVPVITDQSKRDIPLIEKKYAFLRDRKIEIKVVEYTENNVPSDTPKEGH